MYMTDHPGECRPEAVGAASAAPRIADNGVHKYRNCALVLAVNKLHKELDAPHTKNTVRNLHKRHDKLRNKRRCFVINRGCGVCGEMAADACAHASMHECMHRGKRVNN